MFSLTRKDQTWILTGDDMEETEGLQFSDKDLIRLAKSLQSVLDGVKSSYTRDNGNPCTVYSSEKKADHVVVAGKPDSFVRIPLSDARRLLGMISGSQQESADNKSQLDRIERLTRLSWAPPPVRELKPFDPDKDWPGGRPRDPYKDLR